MSLDRIRRYYETFDEWGRLDAPAGALERIRTLQLLDAHLAPGSRVLDVGGGPGRYAIDLAERGHRVTLVDLSARLLRVAREKIREAGVQERVDGIHEASATDLSGFSDAGYDAALCLGPFYHLVDVRDRARAADELVRAVGPGGLIAVAFIPPMSGLAGIIERAARDPAQVSAETLRHVAESGVFRNCAEHGFQEGYYASATEVRELFASRGVEEIAVVSLRGVAAGIEEELLGLRDIDDALYAACLDCIEHTAHREDVIAMGGHALYLGRLRSP